MWVWMLWLLFDLEAGVWMGFEAVGLDVVVLV